MYFRKGVFPSLHKRFLIKFICSANSNRSDQRFERTPKKSEVTPSTQNRFGYKKPVPSPRVTRAKNVPKETTGDKNVCK